MRTHALALLLSSLAIAGCTAPAEDDWQWVYGDDGKGDGETAWPKLASTYALRLQPMMKTVNRKKHADCLAQGPQSSACKDQYSENGAVMRGIVEVAQEGSRVQLTTRLCAMKLKGIPGEFNGGTWMHDKLPPTVFEGAINQGGDGAYAVSVDASAFVFGARLDQPMSDPLPPTGNDPRVRDDDGDGRPGVTVHGGSWYNSIFFAALGIRFKMVLGGTVAKDQSVVGVVTNNAPSFADFGIIAYDQRLPGVSLQEHIDQDRMENDPVAMTYDTKLVHLATATCDEALKLVNE